MTDKRKQPARRQPKKSPVPPRHPAAPEVDAGELADAESLDPAETLREAEEEIGINEWLDPDTGEPAEGQSPPHIERE
ncbi:hypothetical protein JJB11_14695 [Ramlibacter ginsenosidimutans]|uniref:Uncharacterized protein n=1 Tax=Ramlibacter ginsenosidimutans TaxID=502333 RepID=A0A934TTM3_9BURK|nr:hypothetical protein [Ramlibacter ginsenosidimutans]MBK6007347.1 hypothetical protein [Ramlibacter ginsenosidimutans]